ncbi:MAG: helix-turn-helix domain-containing protein [Rhodospirillales bacterium]|nr:helix-turn-helix domain-containing protein [Rhodospirillales bacterium]
MLTPAQTSRKSFDVLRRLAAAGPAGAALADLHAATGLPKSTLHRLLAALLEEGMAMRLPQGRRYGLGPDLFALALQARASMDLVALWQPALRRIVERTGDSAFLLARSGYDAVCLAREDGLIQIRSLTSTVGGRVPLGLGQASAAILALLPAQEAAALLAHNHDRLAAIDAELPALAAAAVASVRDGGFAHGGGRLLADVAGVACPVSRRTGVPDCAVSVASIRARLDGARLPQVVAVLREEIAATLAAMDAP